MKIYCNRNSRELTIDRCLGKDLWVLAKVDTYFQYIKIIHCDDRKVYYYSLAHTVISGLKNPDVADMYKEYVLKCLRTYDNHPDRYYDASINSVTLLNQAYTTEDLYELAEGEE